MKRNKPCNCTALIKAIDAYIAKVDDDIEKNLKNAGFATPKKTVRHMKELEDELAKDLKHDTKMILTTMKDYDDLEEFAEEGWPELRDSDELVEKLTRTFNDQFSKTIPEYTSEYIKRVESDATISRIGLTHQTTSWISSWSGKLAEHMKLSDNNTIEKILSDGLKNGKSVADTAKKISDSGIRDPGYRARRVATTEMLRAHSVAQQESFMQSPAVDSKMWRHSGWREFSRENHIAMDGQTVRKDEPFTLFGADGGIYNPMYPRDADLPPGESINCGCIAQPIVNEYVLGLSLEERNRLRDEAIAEINSEYDKKHGLQPEKNEVTNTAAGGIINTKPMNTKITEDGKVVNPMPEADYDRMRAALERQGIKVFPAVDGDDLRYMQTIGAEGTYSNGRITHIGEIPSRGTFLEEIIHMQQSREYGELDSSNPVELIAREVEANRKLSQYRDAYGLDDLDVADIEKNLLKWEQDFIDAMGVSYDESNYREKI